MPDLELLPLDEAALRALRDDPDAFADAVAFGEYRDLVQQVAAQMANVRLAAGSARHWGGYLAMDRAMRVIVGTCAFKGAPVDGAVEIAYFTFPAFEGRGYATAMAEALLTRTADTPDVRRVLAHTLPEPNASGRILTKLGFHDAGEVYDPEDGPVWRWESEPPAS